MSTAKLSVSHLTKDYGQERGVFDISLDVEEGEIFGYLGTNGSGKTTTIRHMMGFLKPDGGTVSVGGLDPWHQAPEVMRSVSYIPGEIAFPSLPTGTAFLKVQAQYLGVKDFTYMHHLIDMLAIDTSANLKRMSKGMKQKTAIVAALMGDREILILDEPTTGLDPLMRETFLELLREEKAKGRTIFMSSHIFEEIEDVCDRVAILQDGHIRDVLRLTEFRHAQPRKFTITMADEAEARKFLGMYHDIFEASAQVDLVQIQGKRVICSVMPADMNRLFGILHRLNVRTLHEEHIGLEQYFMALYHQKTESEEK